MNTLCNKTNRFLKPIVYGAFIVCLGIGLIQAAPKVGEAFPDLQKFTLEGTLPDLKGKVVLVDFFASWCEPCKASFPVMQRLHQEYSSKGLVVIGINVDEKASDMAGFLKKYPVDFPILRDAHQKLVSDVKIKTMPSSFLLDAQGKIHATHAGFKGEETRKKYVSEIEALLGSK
jgi:cytochrome c biogenesis protein CcmG, thiol:disulfide interchange protein DsbE